MTIVKRLVVFGVAPALLFAVHCHDAGAQVPPPKSEKELVAAGHAPIDGAKLKAMMSGNTVYALFLKDVLGGTKGGVITSYYRDDHTKFTRVSKGWIWESVWYIEGSLVCSETKTYDGTRGGGAGGILCSHLYAIGDLTYMCYQPFGDCPFVIRIAPGNADSL